MPGARVILVGRDGRDVDVRGRLPSPVGRIRVLQPCQFLDEFLFMLAVENVAEEIERIAQALERDPHLMALRFRQILEAMALAKPILTTRVGGIPEIIQNDVNGILVDADEAATLRDQMVRLVGDPELGERLGQEARKTYESRLTYKTFTQQVMKLGKDTRKT